MVHIFNLANIRVPEDLRKKIKHIIIRSQVVTTEVALLVTKLFAESASIPQRATTNWHGTPRYPHTAYGVQWHLQSERGGHSKVLSAPWRPR
jgi:hypothetical protein